MLTNMDDTSPREAADPEPTDTGGRTKYDFFVSCHPDDHAWGEWVAWQLEDADYRILLPDWDFRPGESSVAFLQKAMTQSECMIALLSESYLTSPDKEREWKVAYGSDPSGSASRLLPVRISDCDLPGLLGDIKTFDLFDMADEAATSNLLLAQVSHARADRAKPKKKPPFPGTSKGTGTGLPGAVPRRFRSSESLLRGAPLASLAEYPVRWGEGRPNLDPEYLRRACRRVIADRNVRAAVELIYLVTQNHQDVEISPDTYDLVQQVKAEFREEMKYMDGPQAQQRNLIEPLINLTNGVGVMFANLPIEFVLHDTRDPLRSVCAIQNVFTGRQVGSPVSNVALARIVNPPGPDVAVYQGRLSNGRRVRSTTIPIYHRVFGLIALLCINVDTEKFAPDAPGRENLLRALAYLPDEVVDETFYV
ncbi:TIR domain-containing protein [Frankia tisae]|uniref:TIR domain-containing protein n=1 Tax=Frankia tisae TaxID=2950104 RepID=UPI0021C0A369|nr:TIR domain-containing protein [Frankia tisae]